MPVSNAAGFPQDYLRKLHQQCERMRGDDLESFGDADAWLRNAVDAGSPLALILRARLQAGRSPIRGTDGAADSDPEARRLAIAALTSKRPMVILQAGEVSALLQVPAYSDAVETTAWALTACQRGLDCSTKSDWFQLQCAADQNCQPFESGVDIMRRRLGNDFDAAERRAREINAALDEDRYDDLGF